MQELPLGFVGLCPTPQYADLLQQAMELYWAGRKREAFDMFGRVQGFAAIPGATDYMMVARGVFKETNKFRQQPNDTADNPNGTVAAGRAGRAGGRGGAGGRNAESLTEAQKEFIRGALDEYLKPVVRA